MGYDNTDIYEFRRKTRGWDGVHFFPLPLIYEESKNQPLFPDLQLEPSPFLSHFQHPGLHTLIFVSFLLWLASKGWDFSEAFSTRKLRVSWLVCGEGRKGSYYCLMGIEFQFYKMKIVMRRGGGDGCTM